MDAIEIWNFLALAMFGAVFGLTGLVTTLEKQQLVERERVEEDRRRVLVRLTPTGLDTIEDVFPRFNRFEAEMSDGLDTAEKEQLAHLLRQVITNAGD